MDKQQSDASGSKTGSKEEPANRKNSILDRMKLAMKAGTKNFPDEGRESNLFAEVNALKNKKVDLDAEEAARFSDSFCGKIAKNKRFEIITLTVIVLNAAHLGIDADYNARFGKPEDLYDPATPIYFKVAENFFAFYFTVEVLIRFIGYRDKCAPLNPCGRPDWWFHFDSFLVTLMVLETWLLPLAGTSGPLRQLGALRLLRLLRITRMARLMRQVPELMMIVKGMVAAVRSVGWTCVLLMLITYTWAILFTSEFHEGKDPPEEDEDNPRIEDFFGSLGKSFFSLLIMGTILDDVTICNTMIRSTGKAFMVFAFLIFILISAFMMGNMLLGILVEVVASASEGEKLNAKKAEFCESAQMIFNKLDEDGNGTVSCTEFMSMKTNKKIMQALQGLGIETQHFDMYAELLFQTEDGQDPPMLTFDEVTSLILRLVPGSHVSALDFAAMSQVMKGTRKELKDRLKLIESTVEDLVVKHLGSGDSPWLQNFGGESNSKFENSSQAQLASSNNRMGGVGFEDKVGPPQTDAGMSFADLERLKDQEAAEEFKSVPDQKILEEIQRRTGLKDFCKNGVPLSMMDEELQSRYRQITALMRQQGNNNNAPSNDVMMESP